MNSKQKRSGWTVLCIVALCLLGAGNAAAAAETSVRTGGEGYIEADREALDRLLRILGYLNTPDAVTEDESEEALRRFQRRHGLAATGKLDAETLAAFGGPSERLWALPRVIREVRQPDTLAALAHRLATTVPILLRLNPQIAWPAVGIGERLQVPLDVPVDKGLRPERMQVCVAQFIGSYSSSASVDEIEALVKTYSDTLRASGFSVDIDARSVTGVTFRKGDSVVGRFAFSTQTSDGRTLFDLAVLANAAGGLKSAAPAEC